MSQLTELNRRLSALRVQVSEITGLTKSSLIDISANATEIIDTDSREHRLTMRRMHRYLSKWRSALVLSLLRLKNAGIEGAKSAVWDSEIDPNEMSEEEEFLQEVDFSDIRVRLTATLDTLTSYCSPRNKSHASKVSSESVDQIILTDEDKTSKSKSIQPIPKSQN